MTTDKPNFKRQTDGSLLERKLDGSYRPTASLTDWRRVYALTDDQIDGMARADPDHPAPDDAFWAGVDQTAMKQAVSLKLDGDILLFFREQGHDYENRINDVLRRYVEHEKEHR